MENESESGEANVQKVKNWSPVWIFPIITVLIGAWILFYHYSHQGPAVTLITTNAEGIEGGKTRIKSRSVDVGVVESAILTDDLTHVEIKARLNSGMERLLHKDSLFWVVKPQVGREGISGLGTLLSGAYIELQPGTQGAEPSHYALLDAPPLAAPDAKGIRIMLESNKAGQLSPGDPVLFRGYRVGSVEASNFDPQKRNMTYQLFINAPNDRLVTTNARFWKDSGMAVDLTSAGMRIEMGSLSTLFGGGVSFDVPEGLELGEPVANKTRYHLFDDQKSIQDSIFVQHTDYVMFFKDSVRGLQPGAPVEFRGIRLGTVGKVPFFIPGLHQSLNDDYRIPVEVRIEPGRLVNQSGGVADLSEHMDELIDRGLRGSLKTGNMITGALYIDLDFYPQAPARGKFRQFESYPIIPTVSGGLAQIQQQLVNALEKINNLPMSPLIKQATSTLEQSEKTMKHMQATLDNLNKITASQTMQQLPDDMQNTLRALNRSIEGFQPGSAAYNKMVADMQRLDQVLRELQPILKTLNDKSNALIFEARDKKDPQPKGAKE
ncbi:intermembrane transport protein PqiB [Enterobacteriaceae bacterium ESL0689]|nr:intermembrane transport protein PqiB [Enterobacteriaceae bacterium ESL0689]